MKTLLTTKQRQVLTVILRGDREEAAKQGKDFVPVDLDQLLEWLPYRTTKQSMQFTIRALIKNGLIFKSTPEKRRGRQRVTYVGTELAKRILLGVNGVSDSIRIEDDPKAMADLEEVLKVL